MNPTTDTPLDACPHCGARWELPEKMFACGTHVSPVLPSGRISKAFCSELCDERSARQKADAEVERLDHLLAAASETNHKLVVEVERLKDERIYSY